MHTKSGLATLAILAIPIATVAFACGGGNENQQAGAPTATGAPPPPPPTYYPPPPATGAPPPPATGAPPPATGAPAGTMAVPGPAALPCQSDAQCLTHRCNTQYGKCAFPCQSPADCAPGNVCTMGACTPKLPGQP